MSTLYSSKMFAVDAANLNKFSGQLSSDSDRTEFNSIISAACERILKNADIVTYKLLLADLKKQGGPSAKTATEIDGFVNNPKAKSDRDEYELYRLSEKPLDFG